MSDDITFCYNTKCKHTECMRNPANIQVPYRLHSFGYFKECEHWDLPMEHYAPSREEEANVTQK